MFEHDSTLWKWKVIFWKRKRINGKMTTALEQVYFLNTDTKY